jgi:4-amino-4-deoxy-L-arabinose transferase-like glycosyltransferase
VTELFLGPKAKASHAIIALTVLYFVVTAWNLHIQQIVSPDEPRYAVAARNMMNGGDMFVPVYNTDQHLEKPAFFHWLLVIAGTVANRVGLRLDLAFRFVPLLMGWAAVIGTYLFGRMLFNGRAGFLSAIILMTSYQFHNTARELVVDMTLTAFLLWSWVLFYVALKRIESGVRPFGALLGFYLCLGLACLTKGPFLVGIFSAVPLLAYLFWTRRIAVLLRAGLWWGVPLSLALGLTWVTVVTLKGHDAGSFFSVQNLDRFVGKTDHQSYLPFWRYIKLLPQIFAPAVVLVPFAIWWTVSRARQGLSNLSDSAKMLTCALGISFLIIGISISKRPLYMVPLFPHLSLWIALYIDQTFLSAEGSPGTSPLVNALRAAGVLLLGGCASSIWWLRGIGGQNAEVISCVCLGVAMLLAAFTAASFLKAGQRLSAALRLSVIALLLAIGVEAVVRPIHERALSVAQFYAEVSPKVGDRSLLVLAKNMNPNDASWYLGNAGGRRIDRVFEWDLKARFFDAPGTPLLVEVPLLLKSPVLKDSVIKRSDELFRDETPFVLVEPDPAHPPDPALFKPRPPKKAREILENL